jgi:hypothetical protein
LVAILILMVSKHRGGFQPVAAAVVANIYPINQALTFGVAIASLAAGDRLMTRKMQLAFASALAAFVAFGQFQPQPPQQSPQQFPQQFPQQQPPQPDDPQSADSGYSPDHGVARISYMNGNVSVRRGDSGELVAAVMNVPLTATDRLVTGEGSRAEVQFDAANMIRLGSATEVRFSELAYGHVQVQVAVGTATFRVLRDSSAQVEISTPSVSVRPEKKGIYRVTVRPDGNSEISVRSGDAEVFSPRGSEQVHSGKTLMARGSASDPEFQVTGEVPQDDFDHWSAARDHELERAVSPRYASRDIYGTEDLDANGTWRNDPQYGDVWVPSVDPGWAPYQCGRWAWVDYYGWTWVGCESWGWAPYHYGRWYNGGFGWAWYPGPIYGNYFWRPALVGFFGWGAPGIGLGFGFGFGHVGWVPLAPFEAFRPWYGRGFNGAFRGNAFVNNANIGSMYRNARVANGVSSMNAESFGRSAVNRGSMVRPAGGDLARAGLVRGQLPISQSRESNQFSNRAASTQGLPRTNDSTRFVSRNQPFGGARQSTGQSPQRSFATGGNGATRTQAGPSGVGQSGAGPSGAGNDGWHRFEPSNRSMGGAYNRNGSYSNMNRAGSAQPTGGSGSYNNGSISRGGSAPQSTFPEGNRGGGSYNGGSLNRGGSAPQPRSYGGPQPQSRSYGSPQAVRISPPIVQNRSSSGGGGGSPRGGGGGGGGSHGGGPRGGGHR